MDEEVLNKIFKEIDDLSDKAENTSFGKGYLTALIDALKIVNKYKKSNK